jgi:hypothetical protein
MICSSANRLGFITIFEGVSGTQLTPEVDARTDETAPAARQIAATVATLPELAEARDVAACQAVIRRDATRTTSSMCCARATTRLRARLTK